MIKHRVIFALIIVSLIVAGLAPAVFADDADTQDQPFNLQLGTGDSLSYQDTSIACTVTLTVTSGSINGDATLEANSLGGSIRFVSTTSGTLTGTATNATTQITFNSAVITDAQNQTFTSGPLNVFSWTYGASPVIPTPAPASLTDLPVLNMGWLWVYLFSGDFLGFFQALYVSAFSSVDIFYGILVLLFMVPIYLRTKSLLLICILWIMIGGFFLAAMPIVSGMSMIFLALGIGGLLYRLVRPNN